MKNFKSQGIFLMAMTLAALALPQAANAASDVHAATTSVYVRVADLNLTNPDGINVLFQRLSAASRQVCGNTSDLKIVGSLKQLRLNKECYELTIAQALAEANFPNLAQASNH